MGPCPWRGHATQTQGNSAREETGAGRRSVDALQYLASSLEQRTTPRLRARGCFFSFLRVDATSIAASAVRGRDLTQVGWRGRRARVSCRSDGRVSATGHSTTFRVIRWGGSRLSARWSETPICGPRKAPVTRFVVSSRHFSATSFNRLHRTSPQATTGEQPPIAPPETLHPVPIRQPPRIQ